MVNAIPNALQLILLRHIHTHANNNTLSVKAKTTNIHHSKHSRKPNPDAQPNQTQNKQHA